MTKVRIENPAVAEVFDGYPPKIRKKLLALRSLIFETAAKTDGVGAIEETLKWGEPSYLTPETKSGSTVRIGWKESAPDRYAMYFHCQTTLVSDFRERFSGQLEFEGNRAIVLPENARVPKGVLASCIAAALTYHLGKKSGRR